MIPRGWGLWRHREAGGCYQFLTVALGVGEDSGTDFAYFLGIDPETNRHEALVCRMDAWHELMGPHPADENPDAKDDP